MPAETMVDVPEEGVLQLLNENVVDTKIAPGKLFCVKEQTNGCTSEWGKIKANLMAKNTDGAGASAVFFAGTIITDMAN